MSAYDRDYLEQAAKEAVDEEDYYELLDNMDNMSDSELVEIAGLA